MLTICIQAGGQSSRMGEDKALKPFLGRPLIQRVMERLSPIADEVIVTTNRPADYAFLGTHPHSPALAPGASVRQVQVSIRPDGHSVRHVRLVSDLKPGRGALGGLYTAIASATHPLVAVVACDMPFASAKLIEMASRIMVEEEADVVIPRLHPAEPAGKSQGFEPLHAVYRRATCLPAIEAAMEADQWKVIAWFPQVKLRVLTRTELEILDPDSLAFWNVNTPEEFARAEELATSRPAPGTAPR